MMKRILFVLTSILLVACSSGNKGEIGVQADQVRKDLQILGHSKLFFGHQSVGRNILLGINEWMQEIGNSPLNIIDAQTPNLPPSYLAQANVGRNRFPKTKCDDFARLIRQKFGPDGVQYAFLKFCFVDITRNSNIHEILQYYKATIDSLHKRFPQIVFVHFTVPLKVHSNGLKNRIKSWLGQPANRELDNAQRNAYNRLLKQQFKGQPIFDLAAVEATRPDGQRERFTLNGQEGYSLVPDYSDDGGHLNKTGRKWVAAHLLHFLANLVNGQNQN